MVAPPVGAYRPEVLQRCSAVTAIAAEREAIDVFTDTGAGTGPVPEEPAPHPDCCADRGAHPRAPSPDPRPSADRPTDCLARNRSRPGCRDRPLRSRVRQVDDIGIHVR